MQPPLFKHVSTDTVGKVDKTHKHTNYYSLFKLKHLLVALNTKMFVHPPAVWIYEIFFNLYKGFMTVSTTTRHVSLQHVSSRLHMKT